MHQVSDDRFETDPPPLARAVPGRPFRPRKGNHGVMLALSLVGAAGAFFLFVGAVVLMLVFGNMAYGTEIRLPNGGQLYYTSAVTEAEARKLVGHLETNLLKEGTEPVTIQLTRVGTTYQVRFVVKEGKEKDELVALYFQVYARNVSQEVFDGAAVEVHLCDPSLKTLRVLAPFGN